MMALITSPRHSILHLYLILSLLITLTFTVSSDNENLNPFSNGFNINIGYGCRLVIEKNEWASGCIPAVNFVVKLVDCGEGTAM